MISAKTLAIITAFCAPYIDHPGYVECPIISCSSIGNCVRDTCRPSPINRDARYICTEVYKDCVKDAGLKRCKKGKFGKQKNWSLGGVVDNIISWEHYAPSDAMKGYKRENLYRWREK
jgi:hypothetical protein